MPLCLQQRWAYYFSLPVLALILLRMLTLADIDVVRWGFIAVTLAMLLNAGLGVYHSGIEWGWFGAPLPALPEPGCPAACRISARRP